MKFTIVIAALLSFVSAEEIYVNPQQANQTALAAPAKNATNSLAAPAKNATNSFAAPANATSSALATPKQKRYAPVSGEMSDAESNASESSENDDDASVSELGLEDSKWEDSGSETDAQGAQDDSSSSNIQANS